MDYEEAYHNLLNKYHALEEKNDDLKNDVQSISRENTKLRYEMEMREFEINSLISFINKLTAIKSKYNL